MQMELVTSMLVDTARDALPNVGRIQVAFPETELSIPCVMVRCTMGMQREVGIGEDWSTGQDANMYDITAHYHIYGDDVLDVDEMLDKLSDYIASHRSHMQSWTHEITGESPSMIDCTLVGMGDFGYIEELDAWRKTLTYMVTVVKPQ